MVIIYILLFLFFTLITLVKFQNILRANMLFNIMWCIGISLVSMGYAGLHKPSMNVQYYVICSIIIFNIVYIFFGVRNSKFLFCEKEPINEVRWKVIYISNILAYCFMIPLVAKAIVIIRSYGWSGLRVYAYQESEMFASALQLRVIAWIINPIFTATVIIAVIFAVKKVKKTPLFIMAVADIMLITVALGGRFHLVRSIFYFLFAFIVERIISGKRIRVKKRYLLFGSVAIIFLVYLTTLRSLRGLNFFQNATIYFFGSISYFDIIIHSNKYLFFHNSYLYGRGVFGFVVNPILYIGSLLFNIPNFTSEFAINMVTDNFEYISDSVKYNAMPTSLYPFWRDGGFIGIIIGIGIFAYMLTLVEKQFFIKRGIRHFSLYIFIIYIIFSSVMEYGLLTIQSFANILFIIFCTKPRKLKK